MCDETQLQMLGLGGGALPKTRPVYRHIAQSIERNITTGALALDFRLPAERELAEALKVSRTTVVSAYRDLETRGLVRRRRTSRRRRSRAPVHASRDRDTR